METETIDDTSGQGWLRRRPRPAPVYLGAVTAVLAVLAAAAPSGASTEPGAGTECEDVGTAPAPAPAPAHPEAASGDFVVVGPGMGASGPVDVFWDDEPDGGEQRSTFIEVTCGTPIEGSELSAEDMDACTRRCWRSTGACATRAWTGPT